MVHWNLNFELIINNGIGGQEKKTHTNATVGLTGCNVEIFPTVRRFLLILIILPVTTVSIVKEPSLPNHVRNHI